jgi:flagellar protein FliJ
MKSHSSLPLLISLARDHSDKARRRLQLLLANLNQGQEKLNTLERFVVEYERRLLESKAQGMDVGAMNNYRLFLAKLEQAVEQQSGEVDALQKKETTVRGHWQSQERRRLSFETLQKRFDTQQEKEQARQLQKLLDAFATQRAARIASNTK